MTQPATGLALRGNLFDPDCPTRVVLDRIGDKWTVLVVSALSTGTLRFTELRTRVGRVAPKVLTQTLRALERDGMVSRTVFPEVPPHVEYELTGLGRSLLDLVGGLQAWAEGHIGDVAQARDEYDTRNSAPNTRTPARAR